MSKKKKPAATAAANGKAPPAKAVVVDVLEIDEVVGRKLADFSSHGSDFAKQQRVVEELADQLTVERERLEFLARPLERVHALLESKELAAMAGEQAYDAGFRLCLAKLKFKNGRYERDGGKPNGAKPWAELAAGGATDAQLLKNLKACENAGRTIGGYELEVGPHHQSGAGRLEQSAFYREVKRETGLGYYHSAQVTVLRGDATIVREIRRVLGIGEPANSLPAAITKAKASHRTKKKAKAVAKSVGDRPYNDANATAKPKSKGKSESPAKRKGGIDVLHDGTSPRELAVEENMRSDEASARRLPAALAKK